MQKEEMVNKTYEFIGRLALVFFSQNIKMSFDTLTALLKDNGLDNYAGGRGMAAGVKAAYHRWEDEEKNCRIPTTCGAIANTFVDKNGNLSWLNY